MQRMVRLEVGGEDMGVVVVEGEKGGSDGRAGERTPSGRFICCRLLLLLLLLLLLPRRLLCGAMVRKAQRQWRRNDLKRLEG